VLLALLEVPLVLGPVGPALMAEPILLVTDPGTLIDCPRVSMKVAALAMRLVIEPVAAVDVTGVAMDHTAETSRTIAVPLTHED
jgi:hypothetical protein